MASFKHQVVEVLADLYVDADVDPTWQRQAQFAMGLANKLGVGTEFRAALAKRPVKCYDVELVRSGRVQVVAKSPTQALAIAQDVGSSMEECHAKLRSRGRKVKHGEWRNLFRKARAEPAGGASRKK